MDIDIVDALLWYVVFILSVTVHEAAHAWVAKKGGDLTAYAGGQVSLNPLPHIKREPLGMVVFPIVSSLLIGWPFGYASTPYSPEWAHKSPRKASWMAAAGPGANLFLLLLSVAAIKAGILSGIFLQPDSVGLRHIIDPGSGGLEGVAVFVSMMFTLNLILLILNLLPFPPFDGSGVVALFLSDEAARKYRRVISNPMFGFLGLFLAWQVFSPVFQVVFLRVINLLYWGSGYA
ncbi:MAG: hypothetical protein A2147_10110 [Chloroflexi bacterium RBG_16_57_8]|nr:MAG: hypothetical protein A2147_10110 [Chloroflexi bacterium RBG_16_57_8]